MRLLPFALPELQAVGRSLGHLEELLSGRGWLVYGGDRRESRAEVEVLPWSRIGELAEAMAAVG